MLVATPGQTASYNTLHNNNSNGGGSNNTSAATSATKKSSTLNSTNATASGTAISLNNNNNHTTSTVATKNSVNSNAHTTTFNYHQNLKNDKIISNKLINHNKTAATSSRQIISSTITTATTHSLKNENSTNTTNTTTNKQQSFIQTLKDSVQKALISTTGGSSTNSNANKYSTNNKLQAHCNNSTTSTQNVISSSSSTSHNANKVSTTTSNASSNSTTATQSSSSVSAVRSKYFTCSLSKLHTVAPTVIHRYPEERQDASSADSLQKEMCHFKPIRIVPKTPWKSGSKSRGNCLRFPKANLATKKTEFVLKTNCDVNNRKKKQQQNRAQNDQINLDEDNGDDNEQENKDFHGIYKPKPSLTCLSTSVTTPNHQSAFVCMIAQMKNLVNLQSKRLLQVAKSAGAVAGLTSLEPLEELFIRKKNAKRQQKKEELPVIRSARLSSMAVRNTRLSNKATTESIRKELVKQTKAKSNNISSASTVTITKAKSRRKLGTTKSKTINMVTLAASKAKEKLQTSASMPAVASNKTKTIATGNRNARKRISAQDEDDEIIDLDSPDIKFLSPSPSTTKTASVKSLVLGARKSSRLSSKSFTTNKLFKYSTNINSQQTINKSPKKPHKRTTSFLCFSPPMTRSRHKHLTELGKIVTIDTLDIKKRKI